MTDATTIFRIVPANMETEGVKVVANDLIESNKPGKWKAKVTVYGTGEWGGRKEITFRIGNRSIHWWNWLFP